MDTISKIKFTMEITGENGFGIFGFEIENCRR